MTKTKVELFWEWAERERAERNLSWSAIERAGNMGNAAISKRASHGMVPTYENCKAIARAFKMKDTEVLAKAGLIDPEPPSDTPNIRKMISKFSRLSDEDQIYMLKIVTALEESDQAQQHPTNHGLKAAKS